MARVAVGTLVALQQEGYRGTHFRVISEPYYDKSIEDYVYKVRHSYGFEMFISEQDIRNSNKYKLHNTGGRYAKQLQKYAEGV